VYRFLLSPRWVAGAVFAVAAAAAMVLLGNWQLDRYHERSTLNARIAAAERAAPVALSGVLAPPTATGTAGPAPGPQAHWMRVVATGRYDTANEILVRGRTVGRDVGYEVVTPLRLADGTAVLVDRGWIPPAPGGARALPDVPPAPTGEVQVTGRVHPSESRPGPLERRDGRVQVRRIAVTQLAGELPYPVYGAYLLQHPVADRAFTPIPVEQESALQNGGYAVQWWTFAGMALLGYGWLARREAHGTPVGAGTPAARPSGEVRP
jgi:cytochrome oxidase assembly protein ShyY1